MATGPWDLPGWQSLLEEEGCEVILGRSFDRFPGLEYSEEELIELLQDADAVLVSTRDRITDRVLEACSRLRIVAKSTIGVEKIDLESASRLGVLVVNSPAPENYLGIAEASIGLMLALSKRLPTNQRRLREHKWKDHASLGTLLAGKTVGIVGLGRTGSNVARRLSGWDVELLAADPYVEPAHAYAVGARLVPFETVVQRADILTLHVVLTSETKHMLGEPQLRAMKNSAYLINTSRGGVVDESALAKAIGEGWISGAALDVFEDEPLPEDNPLRSLDPDRLILTPHCIGNNRTSKHTGNRMAMENILRALNGELPGFIKNPPAIELWRSRFTQTPGRQEARA